MTTFSTLFLAAILSCHSHFAQADIVQRAEGVTRTWTINGVERDAIIFLPADKPTRSPLILGFHGHGGRAAGAQRGMHFQTEWPEAVVVYPQGLKTKSPRDPEGAKAGWQNRTGEMDDRDLNFVDVIVESLRQEGWVDDARIFASGHSNGGGFTYALWNARPGMLAAVAPVASGSLEARKLTPLPCMHIAGRADTIVPFAAQERTMAAVRTINNCSDEGTPWAKDCTLWDSKSGTPLVAMITDGGHSYPAAAPALIVRFFKEQSSKKTRDAQSKTTSDAARGNPHGNPPRPNMDGNGPWRNDIGVFRMNAPQDTPQKDADGRIEPLAQVHTFSRAGVASIVRLKSGELLAAFQWFPQAPESFDKIAVSRSKDDGKTWSQPITAQITGTDASECPPFDPTLVVLDDDRIRLYITRNASHDFSKSTPSIGSAISADGQNFTIEPGTRFAVAGEAVIDCAAAKLGSTWHLISPKQSPQRKRQGPGPGNGQGNGPDSDHSATNGKAYHATSTDGINFTRIGDLDIAVQGSWLGALVAIDGQLRFYGGSQRGIWCARSSDGEKWIIDKQFIALPGADPGVAILPNGEMVFVATVMKGR